MQLILSSVKIALKALLINKSRSALTMLGIIIGISAVIIVMSVGAGAQSLILNQIKSVGSNLITVFPGGSEEEGPPVSVMGIVITTLTYEDVEAIKKESNAPHVVDAAAYVQGVATVSWHNRSVDTNFTGTTASYPEVEDTKVARGFFFSEQEEQSLSRVAVLGSQVAENLFAGVDPIGENIKIKKENFRIIGVMEKRGVSGFQNRDDQIYIPLYTAQKILLGINHISLVRAKVDDVFNLDQSIYNIEQTLRERHNITDPSQDDFTVRSAQEAIEAFTNVTNALKFFLAAIAAVSLVVGGIGIMNIMLVSVTERTREIGLRKALGAKRKDILAQFLTESVILTLVGGVAGIIFGGFVAALVAFVARYLGYQWDLVVSFSSVIMAVGVSMFVGIVFGFYPAKRAAELSPIDALRYE